VETPIPAGCFSHFWWTTYFTCFEKI